MQKVRFYYDVVCPYSYMETHAIEAAEDAGEVEVEWLPFELRPAPKALLEVRGNHLRVDWTQNVYAARPGARDRDPPAALPAALDAPACRVPVGGRAGAAAPVQACALRGVLLRGRGHRDRPRAQAGCGARRSRPGRGGGSGLLGGALRSASARSARRRRRPASPACPRSSPRTERRTGGWAGSSACATAGRSCRGPCPSRSAAIRSRSSSSRRRLRPRPHARTRAGPWRSPGARCPWSRRR